MAGFLSGLADRFQTNRPRLAGYLSDHSNALLGFAGGVFGGQGPKALGSGIQGFLSGGQIDRQAEQDQIAEQERQRLQEQETQRQQALALALGGMEGTPPQLAGLYEAYPELGAQAALDYYTPDPVEPVDYPTSVQEYLYGLENPDYAAQMAANGDGVNVTTNIGPDRPDFPTPPTGYDWARDAEGYPIIDPETGTGYYVPVPGGPAEADVAAAEEQAAGQRNQQLIAADLVVEDIDHALNLAGDWTTGLLGAGVRLIPGTPAADLAATLNTIESNVAFDALQEMRNNSPTGGALGAVTERELELLSSTLGSLKQSQSEAQFRRNLERLKVLYLDVIHGQGNWDYGPGGEVVLRGAEADNDPLGIR